MCVLVYLCSFKVKRLRRLLIYMHVCMNFLPCKKKKPPPSFFFILPKKVKAGLCK